MTIHDTLQRKITNWTVRFAVLLVGGLFAVAVFIATGGMG